MWPYVLGTLALICASGANYLSLMQAKALASIVGTLSVVLMVAAIYIA